MIRIIARRRIYWCRSNVERSGSKKVEEEKEEEGKEEEEKVNEEGGVEKLK